MKKMMLTLGIVAAIAQVPAYAQLAPVNEMGISIGHMHLFPPDRDKEARAWLALGGQLGNNLSNNIPIVFPGVMVLIGNARPAAAGSAGSVIDHVAFRVPDLQVSLSKWNGVQTWWKNGTWFAKIEPGKAGQAFVTTPGGVRIEVIEDKSLKAPIVFDHVHYFIDEPHLKAMEDYYVSMFGAKAVKNQADTFEMPGGKLIFAKSDAVPAPSTGKTLDHVGFNMASAETLGAYAKLLEGRGVKFARPYEPASMGMVRLTTEFGTNIEVTKAQGGYFDTKQLDQGYYLVDEGGKKQGEKPTYER